VPWKHGCPRLRLTTCGTCIRDCACFSRRATLINRAIALCVLSGLLVSLVVAALFVSSSLRIDLASPIAVTFVIALLSLAAALLLFLREVFIATRSLTFGGTRPAPPASK